MQTVGQGGEACLCEASCRHHHHQQHFFTTYVLKACRHQLVLPFPDGDRVKQRSCTSRTCSCLYNTLPGHDFTTAEG